MISPDPVVSEQLGFPDRTWLKMSMDNAEPSLKEDVLRVSIVSGDDEFEKIATELTSGELHWQKRLIDRQKQRLTQFATQQGPHILVDLTPPESNPGNSLECCGDYALARDMMGELFPLFSLLQARQIDMNFGACSEESIIGCLAGLELASYDYRRWRGDTDEQLPAAGLRISLAGHANFPDQLIDLAIAQGQAVNVARHLVNLPAAELNPSSYAKLVEALFRDSDKATVTVWDKARLEKEQMGLMLAVGKAADHEPCLIHIRYRHGDISARPLAMVGKGITFDTGGLDLKPAAFMRMMKKDMGGSATLVGLATWLDRVGYSHPVDIWLAVAENAIGEKAFRPGDILKGRNGKTVEIDNTDAEGRLVLADALSVAVSGDYHERPEAIIDVATLTGAARVALGLQVGALFSNSAELSDALYMAGVEAGDPVWPLPLVRAYENELKSPVAQLVNSSTNRFGGAITAAMFLREFVDDVPWAHIDVNAWTEQPLGPVKGPGANGQAVQCLISFMTRRVQH